MTIVVLTDEDRKYRDSLPPLTDAERERILAHRNARLRITADEWACFTLQRLRVEDEKRDCLGEGPRCDDGEIVRKYHRKGRRRGRKTLSLLSGADTERQLDHLLEELRLFNLPITPHLAELDSYLGTRKSSTLSRGPLDERPKFQAAVRYFVEHDDATNQEIADAAGVNESYIRKWRKLSQWENEAHDMRTLKSLGWRFSD